MEPKHSETFRIEPFAISKRRAYELVGYPKLVQRWLFHSRRAATEKEKWVKIVRDGRQGSETLIDFQSLRQAYDRFVNGELPPLLPSEKGGNEE